MAGTIRTGFAETAVGAVQANSGGSVVQGDSLVLQSARCVLCGGTLLPTCGWDIPGRAYVPLTCGWDWTRQSVRIPDLWSGRTRQSVRTPDLWSGFTRQKFDRIIQKHLL
jgi:hypothetical protein